MALDLFGTKAKKEAAKDAAITEAMQKLSKAEIIDALVKNFVESEESWLKDCQSYYDDCRREVSIEEDSFEISWVEHYDEKIQIGTFDDGSPRYDTRRAQRTLESVAYGFTSRGYEPLPEYTASNGVKLSSKEVCEVFAAVVRERLAAAMPGYKFGETNGYRFFHYNVPRPTWKKWF